MSLITGPEWERAVGAYLRRAVRGTDWTARKAQPPGEHYGKGTRFSGAGPADYQLERAGVRVALEVKAHTKTTHARVPLGLIKPSQARDMDKADRAAVLLRVAGYAPQGGGLMSAEVPDLVYLLDWTDLGPLWWTWHEWPSISAARRGTRQVPGRAPAGVGGLTEGDLRRVAVAGYGPDGVRMVCDEHGAWTCPDVLPVLLSGLS